MKHFCVNLLVLASLLVTLSVAAYGVPMPLIHIKGPRIVIEYIKVQLSCVTSNKVNDFRWYFSSNGSETYQPLSMHPSSSISVDPTGAIITIKPVDKVHVGSYRCCATATLCTDVTLSVLFATDDHSTLQRTENGGAVLNVPSGGTFTLAIFHAPFGGQIYIDRESMVPFCDSFRRPRERCTEGRAFGAVTYSVRNAAMEASGQFNVKLLLNKRLDTMRLYILIRGKPRIQMDDYNVLTNVSTINLSCRGFAYPAPNVTFSYTPCPPAAMRVTRLADVPRRDCEPTIILPEHLQRHTPFNYTTSFDAIIPSWAVQKPGIVSCLAANAEGSASMQTLLFIRNFHAPMHFAIVSPTDVVLYDDTVNITCQADVYNYTDQFTIYHGGRSISSTAVQQQYAWVTSYVTHITNTSQNEVACVAQRVKGKLATRSTLNLAIRYPSKPHIVSVNDTVNVTLPLGGTVKLECDIDGTPTPDIVWFKDEDTHLPHGQGNFLRVSLEIDETQATYRCVGRSRLGKATKVWHVLLEDSMHWLINCGWIGGGLLALLLIGTLAWGVGSYRQLLVRQRELEEKLNIAE